MTRSGQKKRLLGMEATNNDLAWARIAVRRLLKRLKAQLRAGRPLC